MTTSALESIQELYVVKDSGLCLFHTSFNGKTEVDQTIVSSFLSAIETFSNNISTTVNRLAMKDFEFVYHREEDLIYVAKLANGVDAEEISRTLEKVSKEFKTHFLKDRVIDGDTRLFRVIGKLFVNNLLRNKRLIHPGTKLEISGEKRRLSTSESKVFSILRLKGRLDISTISRLMKIPEDETINVTKNLLEKNVVLLCS